jgi:hypothetical protein
MIAWGCHLASGFRPQPEVDDPEDPQSNDDEYCRDGNRQFLAAHGRSDGPDQDQQASFR